MFERVPDGDDLFFAGTEAITNDQQDQAVGDYDGAHERKATFDCLDLKARALLLAYLLQRAPFFVVKGVLGIVAGFFFDDDFVPAERIQRHRQHPRNQQQPAYGNEVIIDLVNVFRRH